MPDSHGDISLRVKQTVVCALQLDVEYGLSGGEFRGSGQDVLCEGLIPSQGSGVIPAAFNNELNAQVLRMALVSIDGWQGPIDLARCWFDVRDDLGDSGGARLVIRVVDASTPETDPVWDAYVGYRIDR